jgi:hypothetical protein
MLRIPLVVYEDRRYSDRYETLLAKVFVLLLLAVAAVGVWAADVIEVLSYEADICQGDLEGFRETVSHRFVGVQSLIDNLTTGRDELLSF